MKRREPTQAQRAIAAMGGAMVSAIVITPLDVAKTRLQTSSKHTSMFNMMRRVAAKEGVTKLWTGTSVAIVHAIPTVGVYLMCYDYTMQAVKQSDAVASSIAPLVSGSTARTVAVFLSAPLEQLRTRMQASKGGSDPRQSPGHRVLQQMRIEMQHGGILKLWAGLAPYFIRDVPFSAVYWTALENIRSVVKRGALRLEGKKESDSLEQESMSSSSLVLVNLVSGIAAGSVASAITCPVDVIYVNSVTGSDGASSNSIQVVRQVWRSQGLPGFFRGLVPRVLKVAPSCGIVIAAYELLKRLLSD